MCEICNIPEALMLLEKKHSRVMLDPYQVSGQTSLIFAPKRCVAAIKDLTHEENDELFEAVHYTAAETEQELSCEDLIIFINQGELAGQTTPHLHVQMIFFQEKNAGYRNFQLDQALFTKISKSASEKIKLAESLTMGVPLVFKLEEKWPGFRIGSDREISSFTGLDSTEIHHIFEFIRESLAITWDNINPDGLNIIISQGRLDGCQKTQADVKVVFRFAGDNIENFSRPDKLKNPASQEMIKLMRAVI